MKLIIRFGLILFTLPLLFWGCGENNGISTSSTNLETQKKINELNRARVRSDVIGTTTIGEMELLDFGTVTLNNTSSSSMTLSLPDGASSFTLIGDGTQSGAQDVDISSLVNPNGETWITFDFFDTDPIGTNTAQAFGDTTVAVVFPHAVYSVPSGDYTFTIGNYFQENTIQVYGIINNRTNPTGGTLDLNLIMVSIPDYTGADDPNLAKMVEEVRRIYALHNISLGTISHFTLNRPDLTSVSSIDANLNGQFDTMDSLFQTSSGTGNNAMNFYFVQEMEGGILGISGGIPGPPLIQGTAHSGVVISAFGGFTQMGDALLILQGGTMAHEGGHYLGLFHPTESPGTFHDPISDTPECGPERDTDGSGTVEPEECADLTGSNLMFWGAPLPESGIVQDQLTSGQKFVIDRNPLIY